MKIQTPQSRQEYTLRQRAADEIRKFVRNAYEDGPISGTFVVVMMPMMLLGGFVMAGVTLAILFQLTRLLVSFGVSLL